MQPTMKQRLTNGTLWLRALYMLFYAIAYGIAETIVVFLSIVQFLVILFTGQANERLLSFGNNLATYVYQILRFSTFNSELRPFPVDSWPEESVGENRWMQETVQSESENDEEGRASTMDTAQGEISDDAQADDKSDSDSKQDPTAP